MALRLTPLMVEALRGGLSPIVPLIEIEFLDYTLLHLVGAGEVLWNGRIFRGEDDRFGALLAAGNLRDGVQDEAPDWPLTFAPPSATAVGDLSAAEMQGSPVRAWLGVVDRASGQIVPDPLQVFAGELDTARVRVGRGTRTVEWRTISVLERFHDNDEGVRLSDASHRLIWPGETGCANMTGIERTSYWGVERVPSGVTVGTGGGSGLVNAALARL